MGRICHSGFELQSANNGVEWHTSDDLPAILPEITVEASNVRSGVAALLLQAPMSGTAKVVCNRFAQVSSGVGLFARVAIKITEDVNANTTFAGLGTSPLPNSVRVVLTPQRTLRLEVDSGSGVEILEGQTVLSLGQYYVIQFAMRRHETAPNQGLDYAELRIGVNVEVASSTLSISTSPSRFSCGINLMRDSASAGKFYLDDAALNDSGGNYENAWPGLGRIAMLRPNGAGEFTESVSLSGTIASAFEGVDDAPPYSVDGSDASTFTSAAGVFNSLTSLGTHKEPLAFQPTVVLFFIANHGADDTVQDDHHKGFGVAVSPTMQRGGGVEPLHGLATSKVAAAQSNVKCIYVPAASGGVIISADLVSMDVDGFTINWTKVWSSPIAISYVAFGGSDVQAACGMTAALTAIGTQDIEAGFEPELVLTWAALSTVTIPYASGSVSSAGFVGWGTGASAQGVSGWRSLNGVNPPRSSTRQLSDKIISFPERVGLTPLREAALDSMLPTGFRLNWTTVNATASNFFWLALRGVRAKVGAFNVSGGTQVVSSLGMKPSLLLMLSANKPASTATEAHFRMTWAATNFVNQFSIWGGERDSLSPSLCVTKQDHERVLRLGSETAPVAVTTDAEAIVAGVDHDQFSLTWLSESVVGQEVLYLALAGGNADEDFVTLTSVASSWSDAGSRFAVALEPMPASPGEIRLVTFGALVRNLSTSTSAYALSAQIADGGTKAPDRTISFSDATSWVLNNSFSTRASYPYTLYTQPSGEAWTESAVNSLQMLMRATDAAPALSVTAMWAMVEYRDVAEAPGTPGAGGGGLTLLGVG